MPLPMKSSMHKQSEGCMQRPVVLDAPRVLVSCRYDQRKATVTNSRGRAEAVHCKRSCHLCSGPAAHAVGTIRECMKWTLLNGHGNSAKWPEAARLMREQGTSHPSYFLGLGQRPVLSAAEVQHSCSNRRLGKGIFFFFLGTTALR